MSGSVTYEIDYRVPLPRVRVTEGTGPVPVNLFWYQGSDTTTPLSLSDVTKAEMRFAPVTGAGDPPDTVTALMSVSQNIITGEIPTAVTEKPGVWRWSIWIFTAGRTVVLAATSAETGEDSLVIVEPAAGGLA